VHNASKRGKALLHALWSCWARKTLESNMSLRDDAQQTIYFNNQVVTPSATYIYDAVYRLLSATGREHIGQASQPQTTFDDAPRMHQPLPTDGQAMRNYGETYQYDAVGNILTVIHTANNGNWTRTYAYDEPRPNPMNSRLTSTIVSGMTERYNYDAHGNMTQMPHLPIMEWDFKDQLHVTQQQAVNNGLGEKTYYVYDATGQRARKVTERANGTKRQERIYLGGFEVYCEYDGGGAATLERETLHVMDDQQRVSLVETKTIDVSAASNILPNTAIRNQFDNYLGSACLELDENAAVLSYEEYYPYGSTSYQAGRSAAEMSLKRYRYTGKERDEETGLYYHGARYYAPWLGRWVRADPAGLVAGMNLFAFVQDNPIIRVDRTGRQGDNSIDDIFKFILNEAGFRAGASNPPTVNSSSASPFGTAAHAEATKVLDDLKRRRSSVAERYDSCAQEVSV